MNTPTAITEFHFKTNSPDQKALLRAWLPEIEEAARTYELDDRTVSFCIAAMRLIARSNKLKDFTLAQVANSSGYSRSTFFRQFESYHGFLLKCYQISCRLAASVYEQKLDGRNMSLNEFCTFTMDLYYGAVCAAPNELVQLLWREHNLTHIELHPHLSKVAIIIKDFLAQNQQTQHLCIELKELEGVIRCLDTYLLTARIEGNSTWETSLNYCQIWKMFNGYLLACDPHCRSILLL